MSLLIQNSGDTFMKHPKFEGTPASTSKRMAHVKLKRGKAEMLLGKALWHANFRYNRNDKGLPGSPDIAILKYHIAVFVDGEFWHGQNWTFRKTRLKHNRTYWIQKIEENMARDKQNDKKLHVLGWQPVHFWEKDVLHNLDYCIEVIKYWARQSE